MTKEWNAEKKVLGIIITRSSKGGASATVIVPFKLKIRVPKTATTVLIADHVKAVKPIIAPKSVAIDHKNGVIVVRGEYWSDKDRVRLVKWYYKKNGVLALIIDRWTSLETRPNPGKTFKLAWTIPRGLREVRVWDFKGSARVKH